MFILLTIVFLTINIKAIFAGPILRETCNEITLARHLNETQEIPIPDDIKSKAVCFILFGISYILVNFLYLAAAYSVDLLRWPTLIMISMCVGKLVFTTVSKSKEYNSIPKYSFSRTLRSMLGVTYYGYILSQLM